MENKEAKALNSGNTKPEFKEWNMKKKNCFFITLNCEIFKETKEANKDPEPDYETSSTEIFKKYNKIEEYLTHLKYQYYLAALETNSSGFDHIHIFIQFNSPHKLAINKMEGANIQVMKTSVNSCINYIKKDNDILNEIGQPNLITGSPSIADVLNTMDPNNILENIDFRFYSCIDKIKNTKNWRQGLFNTEKNIYFRNVKCIDPTDTSIKNFHLAELDETHHYKELTQNTAVFYNHCVFKLLKKFNVNHNKFYLADIKNILIIYKDINQYREFSKLYQEHLDQDNIVKCKIIKHITTNN